jgi:iron(III) transport system substrate-binding protein
MVGGGRPRRAGSRPARSRPARSRRPAGSRLPARSRRPARAAAGFLLAVAGVAGTVSGCSAFGSAASGLVLYNGQHVATTDALVAGFTKATGIKVAVRSDDEDVLDEEIITEGSHSPADVVFTENSPALEFLSEHGLLAPVAATTLAQTPARYDSPQRDWVGVSARVSVLVYNPRLISAAQLPRSVLQMAAPRYRGLLALAPGETDFQPVVTSVLRADGRAATVAWLRGLKANAGDHLYPDNETVTNDVNRGEVAFGLINQYYWYRLRAQLGSGAMHSRLATFAPGDPGYVLDVSGAAVLRSSRHQAAAQRFLAYLVSVPGQQAIADGTSFEYPLDHGVLTTAAEPPFASLRPNPVTLAELGDGGAAVALLKQVQLL